MKLVEQEEAERAEEQGRESGASHNHADERRSDEL